MDSPCTKFNGNLNGRRAYVQAFSSLLFLLSPSLLFFPSPSLGVFGLRQGRHSVIQRHSSLWVVDERNPIMILTPLPQQTQIKLWQTTFFVLRKYAAQPLCQGCNTSSPKSSLAFAPLTTPHIFFLSGWQGEGKWLG